MRGWNDGMLVRDTQVSVPVPTSVFLLERELCVYVGRRLDKLLEGR
jgi:hypothetical protein